VVAVHVDAQLVSLVQVLMAHTLPTHKPASSSNEMRASNGEGGSDAASGAALVPDSVRAFALVALGKLCLLDQRLAKECVTLLVREIDHVRAAEDARRETAGPLAQSTTGRSSPAVQSNALLVLGDLCVRYTALVERHLPALARCLQAPHALLRRHALLLLSQLLLQDFLKWRGLLLSRFLLACCDEDAEVAALARFLVTGPLAQKHPALLSHAPVDLLFILNGFEEHPKYQAALLQGSEGQGYAAVDFAGVGTCAGGAVEPSVRAAVVSFVCASLTDEQRIDATARIAHEVNAEP
jgi:condensin-2 complex subunit D3